MLKGTGLALPGGKAGLLPARPERVTRDPGQKLGDPDKRTVMKTELIQKCWSESGVRQSDKAVTWSVMSRI